MQNINSQERQVTYRSERQLYMIVLNISLSSFYVGYVLCYFNSIALTDTMRIFQIKLDPAFTQGFLSFCIPIGAGFGSYLSKYLLIKTSRREYILLVNYLVIGSTILLQIPHFMVIFSMRLFQGFCLGLYTCICSLYIKEFVPVQVSGRMGSVQQLMKVFGIIYAFAQTYVLDKFTSPQTYWRIVYIFPLLITLLQTYNLHKRYNFQTPKYLLLMGREQEARQLIDKIYLPEFIQNRLEQLKRAIKLTRKKDEIQLELLSGDQQQLGSQKQRVTPKQINNLHNNSIAVVAAIHLSILQQIAGIQIVLIYIPDLTAQVYPDLTKLIPVMINVIGAGCTFLTVYSIRYMGRKTLLQFGTFACAFLLLILGYNFLNREQGQQNSGRDLLIMVSLFSFRGILAFTLGPIMWLYIPEIVQQDIVSIATCCNWCSGAFITFFFPIVCGMMNNNPGGIFIILSVYCFLSFIANSYLLIETRNKPEYQIREEYDKKLDYFKGK